MYHNVHSLKKGTILELQIIMHSIMVHDFIIFILFLCILLQ